MKRICLPLLATAMVACQNFAPAGPDTDLPGANPRLAAGTPVTVAGFDINRGGHFAMGSGIRLDRARQAMGPDPNDGSGLDMTYVSFNQVDLSVPGVADADVMVLFSRMTDNSSSQTALAIPLSGSEQGALQTYVLGGGCAVLVADFDHTQDQAWIDANNSFVSVFGMTIAGTYVGDVDAVITNRTTALTDDPGRLVTHLGQLSPGLITGSGPATTIAKVNGANGDAMALIEPGVLGNGSGPVIVHTNALSFADSDDLFPPRGYFGENKNLWQNTIDYCMEWDEGGGGATDPVELVGDLITDVKALIGGALTERDSRGLVRKLEQAMAKLDQGKISSAISKLQDFIGQVDDFVDAGKIGAEDGRELIKAAQAIIDELSS